MTLRTLFRSTAGQDCQNAKRTAVYPVRVLLTESLRSFLDKSGKGIRKEERAKRKAESRKRKEERGKRKEESGKRKLKKVLRVTKHGFVS